MSYTGKVFLLGSCFFGGALMSMDLHKDNCIAKAMKSVFVLAEQQPSIVLFYHKDNPRDVVRCTDFFKRSIESIQWDDQKHGVLHIHFERGKKLEFDVNR